MKRGQGIRENAEEAGAQQGSGKGKGRARARAKARARARVRGKGKVEGCLVRCSEEVVEGVVQQVGEWENGNELALVLRGGVLVLLCCCCSCCVCDVSLSLSRLSRLGRAFVAHCPTIIPVYVTRFVCGLLLNSGGGLFAITKGKLMILASVAAVVKKTQKKKTKTQTQTPPFILCHFALTHPKYSCPQQHQQHQ